MPGETKQEFHDPALKDAVKRCWACDCASEHLRKRVAAILGDEKPLIEKPPRSGFRTSWILWPVGLAAALLISVAMFDKYGSDKRGTGGSGQIATALPVDLETNLIKRHDHCCQQANHQHLPVSRDDDAGIVSAMRSTLNQPVLMYHPADTAWKFRGAAICPVGATPAGHLVFARDAEMMSVFELPKSTLPNAVEGSQFSATVDQHCIVGFVKDGALFCVVGSGPAGTVNMDELQQMTQQMKPAVAFAPAPKPTGVVLTELLRPIR